MVERRREVLRMMRDTTSVRVQGRHFMRLVKNGGDEGWRNGEKRGAMCGGGEKRGAKCGRDECWRGGEKKRGMVAARVPERPFKI